MLFNTEGTSEVSVNCARSLDGKLCSWNAIEACLRNAETLESEAAGPASRVGRARPSTERMLAGARAVTGQHEARAEPTSRRAEA